MTLDQIASAAVAVGTLCAVMGCWRGNPTAMALLSSAIASSAYVGLVEGGDIGFHPVALIAIDILVIAWILLGWANAVAQKKYGRRRDLIILALFVPIWPLYFDDRVWTADAIDVLVAVQMLLCFPIRTLLAKWRERRKGLFGDDGGTMQFALLAARA